MPSAADSPAPRGSKFWLALNTLIILGFIVGGIWLVVVNEEAADVAMDSLRGLFVFFTTPFIMETSLALLAMMTVGLINRWRLLKEGDGWVEMEFPTEPSTAQREEPESGKSAES